MRECRRFIFHLLLESAVIGAVVACDPTIASGIAVGPSPATVQTNLESRVLATTENVARRHGLTRESDFAHVEKEGWRECFGGAGLS